MFVFYDTEFSGLEKKRGNRYLISIGCVAQNGREFYAELTDTWDEHLCSLFVLENVLPLLQGGEYQMAVSELAVKLKSWIDSLGEEEIVFRSDSCRHDWPFISEVFSYHGWPRHMRKKCGAVWFDADIQAERYNTYLEQYWQENHAKRHHALADARGMFSAWRYATATIGIEDKKC